MKVAVIGAYGYTGQLICEELEEANVQMTAVGRNLEKLKLLQETWKNIEGFLTLDMRKPEDAQYVVDSFDCIVNCAGPFTEESGILLEKVAQSGKAYLDITGEIGFIRSSHEKHHQKAQETNSLLIHGCAFESLVADLIFQNYADDKKSFKKLNTFYWFQQKKVSPGTRITMKLSKYRENLKIANGVWEVSDRSDRFKVSGIEDSTFFGVPYPLPEIAYAHWGYNAEEAGSYLLLTEDEFKYLTGAKHTVSGSADEELQRLKKRTPKGPSKADRETQKSILMVQMVEEEGAEKRLVVHSKDMYHTTARAIRLSVEEIKNNGRPKNAGVLSPASLFFGKEREILKSLNTIIKENEETEIV